MQNIRCLTRSCYHVQGEMWFDYLNFDSEKAFKFEGIGIGIFCLWEPNSKSASILGKHFFQKLIRIFLSSLGQSYISILTNENSVCILSVLINKSRTDWLAAMRSKARCAPCEWSMTCYHLSMPSQSVIISVAKSTRKPSAQSPMENVEIFDLKKLSLGQSGAGTGVRTCAGRSWPGCQWAGMLFAVSIRFLCSLMFFGFFSHDFAIPWHRMRGNTCSIWECKCKSGFPETFRSHSWPGSGYSCAHSKARSAAWQRTGTCTHSLELAHCV